MDRSRDLAGRIAPHLPAASTRRVGRLTGGGACGLRARLEERLDDAVLVFELDRLLYDIEVEAQAAWLDTLERFDAYCAGRPPQSDRPAQPPVR
jgi:hypothetical protein